MPHLSLLLLSVAFSPQEPITEPGQVEAVTLYRGQALITRSIPLPTRSGSLEIVVPDIPEAVLPSSLYAEGSEATEVRAVRYRTHAVGETPHAEIRALQLQIEEAEADLETNEANQSVAEARIVYLDRLEGFVASTAHGDLSKGALDADSLERLVLFGFEHRQEASDDLMTLGREAKELRAQKELLERQLSELSAGSSKTVREAVLFLERQNEGAGTVRLSYLVASCGWSPVYNLRADAEAETIRVEYDALIHQLTGENWDGVQLTLSTASPALSAEGPGLAPFTVLLAANAPAVAEADNPAQHYQSIVRQQADAQSRNRSEFSTSGNFNSAWDINVAANDLQTFELVAGNEVLTSVAREIRPLVAGPSLSYSLEVPVSLASRSDRQMVRIARSDLKADLHYSAIPVLSPHVFREAACINTSGYDFLAGPVSAYLDDRFVGRAEIGNVSQGQTFAVGLGADPGLLSRRELVDKDERVQGGNRILDIEVRLSVENFHDRAITVRLFDRVPYTDRENDLRVTLGEMSDELSTDAQYLASERPKGILRWDVEIAAGAGGDEDRAVDYAYTLEYDRERHLATATGRQAAFKQEFELLEKARGRR